MTQKRGGVNHNKANKNSFFSPNTKKAITGFAQASALACALIAPDNAVGVTAEPVVVGGGAGAGATTSFALTPGQFITVVSASDEVWNTQTLKFPKGESSIIPTSQAIDTSGCTLEFVDQAVLNLIGGTAGFVSPATSTWTLPTTGMAKLNIFRSATIAHALGNTLTISPKMAGSTLTGVAGECAANFHLTYPMTLATWTILSGDISGTAVLSTGDVATISGNIKGSALGLTNGAALTLNESATLASWRTGIGGITVKKNLTIKLLDLSVAASITTSKDSKVIIEDVINGGIAGLTIVGTAGGSVILKAPVASGVTDASNIVVHQYS